jgi:hypothetical protein
MSEAHEIPLEELVDNSIEGVLAFGLPPYPREIARGLAGVLLPAPEFFAGGAAFFEETVRERLRVAKLMSQVPA